MSELRTVCKGNKIALIDEQTDTGYETTDQEKAISAFRSWLLGGTLPCQ